MPKARGSRVLARWQVRSPAPRAFPLAALDPGAKPFSLGEKAKDQAAVEELAQEIDVLQDCLCLLYTSDAADE